jgi:hypothetical protein
MGNNACDMEQNKPNTPLEEVVRLMQAAQNRLDEDDVHVAKSLIAAAIKIATNQ